MRTLLLALALLFVAPASTSQTRTVSGIAFDDQVYGTMSLTVRPWCNAGDFALQMSIPRIQIDGAVVDGQRYSGSDVRGIQFPIRPTSGLVAVSISVVGRRGGPTFRLNPDFRASVQDAMLEYTFVTDADQARTDWTCDQWQEYVLSSQQSRIDVRTGATSALGVRGSSLGGTIGDVLNALRAAEREEERQRREAEQAAERERTRAARAAQQAEAEAQAETAAREAEARAERERESQKPSQTGRQQQGGDRATAQQAARRAAAEARQAAAQREAERQEAERQRQEAARQEAERRRRAARQEAAKNVREGVGSAASQAVAAGLALTGSYWDGHIGFGVGMIDDGLSMMITAGTNDPAMISGEESTVENPGMSLAIDMGLALDGPELMPFVGGVMNLTLDLDEETTYGMTSGVMGRIGGVVYQAGLRTMLDDDGEISPFIALGFQLSDF